MISKTIGFFGVFTTFSVTNPNIIQSMPSRLAGIQPVLQRITDEWSHPSWWLSRGRGLVPWCSYDTKKAGICWVDFRYFLDSYFMVFPDVSTVFKFFWCQLVWFDSTNMLCFHFRDKEYQHISTSNHTNIWYQRYDINIYQLLWERLWGRWSAARDVCRSSFRRRTVDKSWRASWHSRPQKWRIWSLW